MKKILILVIMFGVFTFLPIRPMAMVELDENGNAIEKEVKEGEVSILMATDEVSPDNNGNATSGPTSDPNKSVSSNENSILSSETDIIYQATAAEDDTIYQTTGAAEDAVKTTSTEEVLVDATVNENNSNVPTIIISGMGGIVLGALAVFVIKRKSSYEHAI
jgi:hypothetical protein